MKTLRTCLGVFGLFLLVLESGGCHGSGAQSAPQQATPTPRAGTDPSAAALAALTPDERDLFAASKGEKWHRSETIDAMDGTKTVRFMIWAKNKVVQKGTEEAPLLSISCGKSLLTYVVSGPVRERTVPIRFDDGAVTTTRWSPGDDILASASPSLVRQLVNARTFRIEYTPWGSSPQVAIFNMANLKELVPQEKLCKI